MSFSDSAILRHIARQPKQTASHKQLLRELGVKGDARRELADRLYASSVKANCCKSTPSAMPFRRPSRDATCSSAG